MKTGCDIPIRGQLQQQIVTFETSIALRVFKNRLVEFDALILF